MQPSDFLTILGLGLAIWSFIPQKERNFIMLFFSKTEIIIFFVSLLYILFLMSFDWLKENWFGWLSVFTIDKGIPAAIWAFIIALLIITLPIVKVSFGYFSKSRLDELLKLYKVLINANDIDLLAGYIEKYHLNDIYTYLKGKSSLPEYEFRERYETQETPYKKAFEKLTKPQRIEFAYWIYETILTNDEFIKNAANKYPELFAKAFSGMESKRASDKDAVQVYIETIFENKNQKLIRELKIADQSSDSLASRTEYNEMPILSGLLINTVAAADNYVWYPVGEGAVKSLKYDEEQKEFLVKEHDDKLEPELWNQKVWIATVYFNYMVRETIYNDPGWHMWLFYFRHTVDYLIDIIPEENSYNPDAEYPSFAHFIIYRQFDAMIDWIELAKDKENDHRVIDTIRCLGWCINSVCQADERKMSREFKKSQLERLVSLYCEYAYFPDNVACTTAREWLTKLFLSPKGVDFGPPEFTDEYRSIMAKVWDDFDRIPFTAYGNGNILDEFETNILLPLGIANDE